MTTTHTTIAAGKLLNFDRSKPDSKDLVEVFDENNNKCRMTIAEAEEFHSMTGKDPTAADILSPEVFDELIGWLREEELLEKEKTDPRNGMLAPPTPANRIDERYRGAAREYHASTDLQIDDHAIVSHGENGAWVQAWVWIDDCHIIPNPTF